MKPTLLAFLVLLFSQALGSRPYAALPNVTWTQWVYCYSLGVGCEVLRERLDALVVYTPPGPNAYIARPVEWPLSGSGGEESQPLWVDTELPAKRVFRAYKEAAPDLYQTFVANSRGVALRVTEPNSAWFLALPAVYHAAGMFTLDDSTVYTNWRWDDINSPDDALFYASVLEHELSHILWDFCEREAFGYMLEIAEALGTGRGIYVATYWLGVEHADERECA